MAPGTTHPVPRPRWWDRLFLRPIRAQLTQGTSPETLARTLAIGTACSLLPFLGFTSLLNLAVGLVLKLNQPLLQLLNQLLAPVQLALILGYVRLGEWLWHTSGPAFAVSEMVRVFRDVPLGEFLHRFGLAGWHAFTAWLLTAPLIVLAVEAACRPPLRRFALRLAS